MAKLPNVGASNLKSGMKPLQILVDLLGLVLVALGLYLGVGKGDTLGAMVCLTCGVAVIVEGMWVLWEVKL